MAVGEYQWPQSTERLLLDQLQGTATADTLSGVAGDDKLEGLAGNDVSNGGLALTEPIERTNSGANCRAVPKS